MTSREQEFVTRLHLPRILDWRVLPERDRAGQLVAHAVLDCGKDREHERHTLATLTKAGVVYESHAVKVEAADGFCPECSEPVASVNGTCPWHPVPVVVESYLGSEEATELRRKEAQR